jgi:ankyrin repeat protein
MARIFLCHASEDKAQVREVYYRLRSIDGFEPWLDEENLLPGQEWAREIPRALQASDFILIFLSRTSVAKRGYVQREMKLALDAWQELPEGTIHTIPVRIDDCDVPASFRGYHWVNLFEPNGVDRIIHAIRAEMAKRPPDRLSVARPPSQLTHARVTDAPERPPPATRVATWRAWLKKHPLFSSLIAFGIMVVAVAILTGIPQHSPEAARRALSQLGLPYTPDSFITSAEQGDVHAVKLFLAAGMDPNVTDKESKTALMYAAEHAPSPGYTAIIEALLQAKADVNNDKRFDSALTEALEQGNLALLRTLLEHGANTETINRAFVTAAGYAQRDSLRLLLDKGAEVREVGGKALVAAAFAAGATQQISDTISFLLEHGVDANARNEDRTALIAAVHMGHTAIVQTLLDKGADINAQCSCSGMGEGDWTPLLYAIRRLSDFSQNPEAEQQEREIAHLLLSRGADVNQRNTRGESALLLAADAGDAELVRALLDKEADVNVSNKDGWTPLFFAANRGKADFVRALLDKGADINAKSVRGGTPLMVAARSGSAEAIELLIARGAEVQAKNAEGKTALDFGRDSGDIVRLLTQAGAR